MNIHLITSDKVTDISMSISASITFSAGDFALITLGVFAVSVIIGAGISFGWRVFSKD